MASCASCALFSALVDHRLLGQRTPCRTSSAMNSRTGLHRVVGEARGVGAHVGDERRLALLAEVHALVEPLGERHGLLGGEVEPVGRLLLQLGGDERRGRRCGGARGAPPSRPVKSRLLQLLEERVGGRLVGELGLLAVQLRQPGAERRRATCPRARASSVQYSSGTKALISRSRSTISRTATDCTRPAERPRRTFFQSSGLIW